MTQHRKSLNTLLREARDAGEVPYSLLDTVLERPHALDRELNKILTGLGDLALTDDRLAQRILDDQVDFGVREDTAFGRFVVRTQFLTAEEEVRLAKRIEFARRRLEKATIASNASSAMKERYFELIETPEGARDVKGITFERRPDERMLARLWDDYLALRNELIESNLALVERIAARYRTYGIPNADLVQHGNLGLIRAADKFDWRKNVRFRTYAEWWIRQAIERATDTDRDVIHVPRPMRQKMSKANHLNRALGSDDPLDSRRFSELMGVDRAAAARVFSIKSGVVSLERAGLEEGHPMKNDLVGPDLSEQDDREQLEHLRSRLGGMINELPEREQRVINLRYGLGGEQPHTLEEVGEILNISRERVRQLQMRAIDHLRVAAPDPRYAMES